MSNYDPNTTPIGPPQGPPGYPGQPIQPPAPKSKTWIWVLGGCGVIILIGVVAVALFSYFVYKKAEEVKNNPAMATAKMMVALNPDLETVSTDESKGTITIRDKKTGKVVTVNFDDVKEGKVVIKGDNDEAVTFEAKGGEGSGSFEVKSDKGSVKFGAGAAAENVPAWIPSYPGSKAEGTYSMRGGDGNAGAFAFTTTDSVDHVMSYYETELRGGGMKVSTTTSKVNGESAGVVTGADKSNHRTVVVTVGEKSSGTQVSVTFAEKD